MRGPSWIKEALTGGLVLSQGGYGLITIEKPLGGA